MNKGKCKTIDSFSISVTEGKYNMLVGFNRGSIFNYAKSEDGSNIYMLKRKHIYLEIPEEDFNDIFIKI